MAWTIYCHTLIADGRRYVGLTKRTMLHRWNQHCAQAKNAKGGRWHFPNAIRKYGKDAFSHEVLEVCLDLEVANLAEESWIELLDTRNAESGFNLTRGGNHVPHPITARCEHPKPGSGRCSTCRSRSNQRHRDQHRVGKQAYDRAYRVRNRDALSLRASERHIAKRIDSVAAGCDCGEQRPASICKRLRRCMNCTRIEQLSDSTPGRSSSAACAARAKKDVISHYTNGSMACRCGVSDMRVLSVACGGDYKIGIRGSSVYNRVRKDGYPPGITVGCLNCFYAQLMPSSGA